MVACSWLALGALSRPGLSASHRETPGGVSLPHRTQWLTGCPPGAGDRNPRGSTAGTVVGAGDPGSAAGSDTLTAYAQARSPAARTASSWSSWIQCSTSSSAPRSRQAAVVPTGSARIGDVGRGVAPGDVVRDDDAHVGPLAAGGGERVEVHRQQPVEVGLEGDPGVTGAGGQAGARGRLGGDADARRRGRDREPRTPRSADSAVPGTSAGPPANSARMHRHRLLQSGGPTGASGKSMP